MPSSEDFVVVFVNTMSFCCLCRILLCGIVICGHVSYLQLRETSPVLVCTRACGYSHNDLLINGVIFMTSSVDVYRSRSPVSPSLVIQTWRL
jgi:hypothetical protein